MIPNSGDTSGVSPKKTTGADYAGDAEGKVGSNAPGDGINWAKATLDDLRIAFILSEGPEKGMKQFNQFQLMLCQTCISQMKAMEPKKHDDSQNQ